MDLGGEIMGSEVQELCSWIGIEVKASASHHPQANGQFERANQDLSREIHRIAEVDDDWDLHLRHLATNSDAVEFIGRYAKEGFLNGIRAQKNRQPWRW